ncbi:MAG: hypothetical protein ACTILG_08060 [Sphingobacterium sp.]
MKPESDLNLGLLQQQFRPNAGPSKYRMRDKMDEPLGEDRRVSSENLVNTHRRR